VHLAAAVMVTAAAVMPPARARAKHEAGTEDHGHDEYDACDDADPRGGGVQLDAAAPPPFVPVVRLDDGWRCCRGADGAGARLR
jgi:hypothetical protein